MFTKGQIVTIISGTKIPHGTSGPVVWVGEGKWGPRVGFKSASGETLWTAPGNLSAAGPVAVAAPAGASTIGRQRLEAVEAQVLALTSRIAALEAALTGILGQADPEPEPLPFAEAA